MLVVLVALNDLLATSYYLEMFLSLDRGMVYAFLTFHYFDVKSNKSLTIISMHGMRIYLMVRHSSPLKNTMDTMQKQN